MSSTPTPDPFTGLYDQYAKPGALTPAGAEPIVRALGVHKYFGGNHVLRGATIEVYPGRPSASSAARAPARAPSCAASTSSRSPRWARSRWTGCGSRPSRSTRAIAATASRSARCGSVPRWCSRSSTCSRISSVIDNLIEGPIRVKGCPRTRPSRPRRSTSPRSVCRRSATSTRHACRVARSSAWRSLVR